MVWEEKIKFAKLKLMKKIFFIVIFGFIFLPRISLAQVPTLKPTATPEPGHLGGPCVKVDPSEIEKNLEESKGDLNKTGGDEDCIKLGPWKIFCLSQIIENTTNKVKTIILTKDLIKAFQEAGVCREGRPSTADINSPECRCINDEMGDKEGALCHKYLQRSGSTSPGKILKNKEYLECLNCFSLNGFWSGIGCVYLQNWQEFFSKNVFGFLIGLAGIIVLLCIIFSAFTLQISQGNPEKIKKAQERLTSCILGLLLIIFSIFILKLIGVDILRIPGFSFK